jgi:phosphotransferase system HPr (HPr) family protein
MKEVIRVSREAAGEPKFEVKLVGALSHINANVFLISETVNDDEAIVKRVNAKSLIGVLSMELKGGETLTVHAVGDDEGLAVEKVKSILTA